MNKSTLALAGIIALGTAGAASAQQTSVHTEHRITADSTFASPLNRATIGHDTGRWNIEIGTDYRAADDNLSTAAIGAPLLGVNAEARAYHIENPDTPDQTFLQVSGSRDGIAIGLGNAFAGDHTTYGFAARNGNGNHQTLIGIHDDNGVTVLTHAGARLPIGTTHAYGSLGAQLNAGAADRIAAGLMVREDDMVGANLFAYHEPHGDRSFVKLIAGAGDVTGTFSERVVGIGMDQFISKPFRGVHFPNNAKGDVTLTGTAVRNGEDWNLEATLGGRVGALYGAAGITDGPAGTRVILDGAAQLNLGAGISLQPELRYTPGAGTLEGYVTLSLKR